MRSYKDCLIEYVEERSFSELNISWFHYINNTLNSDVTSFQILESIPPVTDALDVSFYADIIPSDHLVHHFLDHHLERRSDVYKNLIRELVVGELKRIQSRKDSRINLKLLEEMLQYPQSKQYSSYSKAFKECLVKAGFEKEFITNFFLELEEDEANFFSAIEKFYDLDNYHLSIPKYGIQSTTSIIGTLAVDFDSHCLYNGTKNKETEQVVIPNSSFISGDDPSLFFSINSKAKLSPVKVSGELHGINKTSIQVGNWFDQEMINQLFKKENRQLNHRLDYSLLQKIQKSLQKRFKSFYSFEVFDLTIEIQNHFTKDEVDLLRNKSFSLFPFHLSTDHECYKWIDRNEEGNLKIRIKSKTPQQTFFGAEIETVKV